MGVDICCCCCGCCCCCCCGGQASDQYLLEGLKRLCEASLAQVSSLGGGSCHSIEVCGGRAEGGGRRGEGGGRQRSTPPRRSPGGAGQPAGDGAADVAPAVVALYLLSWQYNTDG
jgi:hypothetical protein